MLSAAEQLVVLFDEFDEMVRNRALTDELLSRFLTTAMLPKLARINKERRILFIVATNYIHTFDVAISRAGRFDLVLQMMPPLVSEKIKKWREELENLKGIANDVDFDTKLGDLTFLETEALTRRFRRLGDTAEAQAAQDLWTEVIDQCTLYRINERAAGTQELADLAAPAAPGSVNRDGSCWKDTAIQEVRFIRLN
jgi:SpoVK/Ycf46/Vps4 family AAA+-type ATPase